MTLESWTPDSTQECARALATGESRSIDLTRLVHEQGRHADLVALSALAWWLLAQPAAGPEWCLRVPRAGGSAFLPLVRSGLLVAAQKRGLRIVDPDGQPVRGDTLAAGVGSMRLPGVDWATAHGDAEPGGVPLAMIIPDLTDPRRSPQPAPDRRLTYPWLQELGLRTKAITRKGYDQLLADVDLVIRELIDNVHRWSAADDAFAVVSTTKGSRSGQTWRQLHIVVADTGIGIPLALRRDTAALDAVHRVSGRDQPLGGLDDEQIVHTLLRYSFGDRNVPHHNGNGLHVAQHRSGMWAGRINVITIGTDREPFQSSTRGVNAFDPAVKLDLPGARGTLVHVLIQAATEDSRTAAAELEQLSLGASAAVPLSAHPA